MTPETLLQPLIFGIQIGLTYVLTALGLTVIFSIMNVLNLAHGEFYMAGAVLTFYLAGVMHINYAVALVAGTLAAGVIGVLVHRFIFLPTRGEVVPTVIVGIGLMWILQSTAQLVFGRQPRGMGEVVQGTTWVLNVSVSNSRMVAALISIALVGATYLFIYKTRQGRAMQAVAQDRDAAALQGVDIDKIGLLGFAVGCALAGAAGGIMAPIFFVEATMGTAVLTKSLSIIILGGLGSIPGAVLGGLILGLLESYGSSYLGYASTTFPFLIIILILLFKRTGLMGREV